jgi:hypothetical protein
MEPEGSSQCSHKPGKFLYHDQVHTMPPYFFKIFYSCLCLPTEFFPSVFATKTNKPLPPIYTWATRPSDFSLLGLLTQTPFNVEHIHEAPHYQVFSILLVLFFGTKAPSGPGLPHSRGFYITHNDTPQLVGLLWTSDQLVTETSTSQHTTLTTDRHLWPQLDSNPQSRQASGRRPRP